VYLPTRAWMSSIGLWWWHININTTILDSTHRPVFLTQLDSTLKVSPHLAGNKLRLLYEPNRLILSIGLWRWYINITIAILDIIHRPVFYLKHDVSESGFWILQVEPTQMGPIGRVSLCVLGPPEDWDRIESPKHRVLNKRPDDEYVQNCDNYIRIVIATRVKNAFLSLWWTKAIFQTLCPKDLWP
jgi:hypothetical protein